MKREKVVTFPSGACSGLRSSRKYITFLYFRTESVPLCVYVFQNTHRSRMEFEFEMWINIYIPIAYFSAATLFLSFFFTFLLLPISLLSPSITFCCRRVHYFTSCCAPYKRVVTVRFPWQRPEIRNRICWRQQAFLS